jgi:hypothetical protein
VLKRVRRAAASAGPARAAAGAVRRVRAGDGLCTDRAISALAFGPRITKSGAMMKTKMPDQLRVKDGRATTGRAGANGLYRAFACSFPAGKRMTNHSRTTYDYVENVSRSRYVFCPFGKGAKYVTTIVGEGKTYDDGNV